LALAKNLEKCGRTQDAAKIFEELQMYDKSRELRQQDRNIVIKNTNVSVNLNSLLQQVKDGGIVAVFRCPVCGGKLKVNQSTTLDSLKKCEHCDSDISTLDLADFLKTIL
jgi:transcription initiation factor IIE alpha subunit